jgi:hypothetical protein
MDRKLGICRAAGRANQFGSITTLATDRFRAANTFTKLGAAQALNQSMQCVGAILIAPLVRKFPTRTVLAAAVWGHVCYLVQLLQLNLYSFALMTTILLSKLRMPKDVLV